MVISTLEWFFGGEKKCIDYISSNNDEDEEDNLDTQIRVNWDDLVLFGWDSCYLSMFEYASIPNDPGIYVVIHEWEKPVLYVGQSTNLKRRITDRNHHKISKIIELWENAPMGYHDKGNVLGEMRVFWKPIKPPYYNGSLEKNLVWCESITIGLLCPILQSRADDVKGQEWAIGMNYYD